MEQTTGQTVETTNEAFLKENTQQELSLKSLFNYVFMNATSTEMVSGKDIAKEFNLSQDVAYKLLEHLVQKRILVRVSNDPKEMYEGRTDYLNLFYELQAEGTGGALHEVDRRNVTIDHIVSTSQ